VAATAENTKCPIWYQDAFSVEWMKGKAHFMNPPYGDKKYSIEMFLQRAYEQSRTQGIVVACLIPFKCESWWIKWVMKAHSISVFTEPGRFPFCDENDVESKGNDFAAVCVVLFDGTKELVNRGYVPLTLLPNYKESNRKKLGMPAPVRRYTILIPQENQEKKETSAANDVYPDGCPEGTCCIKRACSSWIEIGFDKRNNKTWDCIFGLKRSFAEIERSDIVLDSTPGSDQAKAIAQDPAATTGIDQLMKEWRLAA